MKWGRFHGLSRKAELSAMARSNGSLYCFAEFNQVTRVNFRPPSGAFIRGIERLYSSGFFISIPSPVWTHRVRFHYSYQLDVTA